MFKSIALWLCPSLVEPAANAEQLAYQEKIVAEYTANNALVLTQNQTLRDALDGALAELQFAKKTIAETKEALTKTNDACNAEIDKVSILQGQLKSAESVRDAIIARIETTLIDYDKRDLKQKPMPTYSKLIANHRAILDEIGRIVTTAKNLTLKS